MKKEYHTLTQSQKREYEEKANYLLNRGYVYGKTLEELAREIYLKEKTE
jgi:hypothetical protein